MTTPPVVDLTTQQPRVADADQATRRSVIRSLVRSLLTAVALVWLYFVVPVSGHPTATGIGLLVIGLVACAYLLARQVRAITESTAPRLKALEVLASSVPLFILIFAMAYFLLDHNTASAFSQTLTRTDSLYFTITVFATVGFGDIVALSETARVMVMVQMVGDLIVIGFGVRMLLQAVQVGLARQSGRETQTLEEARQSPRSGRRG